MKNILRTLILFLIFLLIYSCAPKKKITKPLIIGVIGDMDTTNDFITQNAFSSEVINQIYLHLFKENTDFQEHPPTFSPEIVEKYEFEDDYTLNCKIREDLFWSNGQKLTVKDIIFTHKSATSKEVAWIGIETKKYIKEIIPIDDYNFQVTFTKKTPYMLMDLNEGVIYPENEFGKIPYKDWRNFDFSKIRVFSGPYILKDWRKQEAIYLEKNPYFYKKGYPLIENVVFRIVPDQNSLLTQFLSYAVDMMELIPPKDVEKVKKDPNLELVTYPDRQYVYIGWNLKNPLFKNRNVRRALSMSINIQEIIDVVWHGLARQSIGPVHSSLWAFNKNLTPISFDLEKAREILKKEGIVDKNGDGILEINGKPFEFELITNKGNAIREQTAVLIQNHLSKLGVKVNLNFLEWNKMIKSLMSKTFDACLQGWRVATKVDFKEIWHSSSIDGGYNIVSYSNSEVDKLIEEMENLLDYNESKKYIDKIQEIIYEDQPYTFLYENMKINGINKKVKGYDMNEFSAFYNLYQWKID